MEVLLELKLVSADFRVHDAFPYPVRALTTVDFPVDAFPRSKAWSCNGGEFAMAIGSRNTQNQELKRSAFFVSRFALKAFLASSPINRVH